MAISVYDEEFLTDEQRRQLDAFTKAWERASAAGDRAGMEAYADTPIAALSGGQLQRALFARALITRAEVLVLDEPTSYVDKTFERQMLDMLEEANRTATVLLVSHEADCFAALANRTFRIHATLEEVPQR